MENLKFGMNADPIESATTNDFVEFTNKDGENYNPYNKAYFNDPTHMSACKDTGRITSIPSPYARMHITDLAFQEYNCGTGTMSASKKANRIMSADYKRAMSHCLDLFEMMYYADECDWKEKGITLHKIELISTNSQSKAIQEILYDDEGNLNSLGRYIATLDLFRNEYKKFIDNKGVNNYSFDFSSLYIFKYKGKTFASTSPFTGFSAKSDCDLDAADIKINGRKILSKDSTTWMELDGRDVEFKKFLYLLLKDTGLKGIFTNLFASLENTFDPDTKTSIDNSKFNEVEKYQKFNIGTQPLQKVKTKGNSLFIRPDGFDSSYLKYLLYIENPVELTIRPEDYEIDLKERRFPSVGGNLMPWYGANDILADSLFVLTYEINDNYIVVPFVDKVVDDQKKRRCLLPIKRKALDFFAVDDLVNNMTIIRKAEKVFSVTLNIQLENGGHVVLRREYTKDNCVFPNGTIVSGETMKPFAFGIYPFVKSSYDKNIYKVLFYNSFEENYKIKFFKRDSEGVIHEFLETECDCNKTNDIHSNADELPVNCEYHHLETDEGLEFAELEVMGKGTSLIIPKMREPHTSNCIVNVGIDLGTSNTYIAYTYKPEGDDDSEVEISEICTNHGTWNELTFMNKKCEKTDDPNAPEKNREDLYLKTSDRDKPSDEWLDSQLCEFIPSRIDPNMGDESYCFPIPSVINILRKNAKREKIDFKNDVIPLLHCAIPFAYYERGTREGLQKFYYDIIKDGSQFKWFYKKNEDGDWETNEYSKAFFKAFVSELMFIVRSHLVSCGHRLDNTKILWSYPLSFSPELVQDYVSTWNGAYKKFINPGIKNNDIAKFVQYTNESRSPIFECLKNPSNVDHLTLLVDIGGGSTDIIGYKNRKPLFISSFGFAGNALYLDGNMNNVDQSAMKETILSYYISKQDIFKNEQNGQKTKKISLNDPISTLMNYGFTKDPDNFKKIFNNPGPKFMLLMHNSAIIYHMAQLCKIKSANEAPVEVFLTGNGSKLFYLNKDYKDTIKSIFDYVYNSDGNSQLEDGLIEDMKIRKADNPKAATVWGALKGFNKGLLETNENASSKRIVMLGDNKTIYEVKEDEGGAKVSSSENYSEDVKQNVIEFVDMFYDIIYTTSEPVMKKDAVLRAIDHVQKNGHLKIGRSSILTDSLFFQYISLLMEKVSFDLKDKKQ